MQTHNDTQRHWMLALGVYVPDENLSNQVGYVKNPPIDDYRPRYQGRRLTKEQTNALQALIKEHLVKDPDAKASKIHLAISKTGKIPKRECGSELHFKTIWRHIMICRKELLMSANKQQILSV